MGQVLNNVSWPSEPNSESAHWGDKDQKKVDVTQEPQHGLGLKDARYDGGQRGGRCGTPNRRIVCFHYLRQNYYSSISIPLSSRLEFSSLQELNGPRKETFTFWHLGSLPVIKMRYLLDPHLNSRKSSMHTQSTSPAFQHPLTNTDGYARVSRQFRETCNMKEEEQGK